MGACARKKPWDSIPGLCYCSTGSCRGMYSGNGTWRSQPACRIVATMKLLIVPAVVISCATVGLAQTQPSPPLQLGPPTAQGLIGYDGAGGAGAATQPAVDPDNIPRVEAGFTECLSTRFRAHEPIYFIAG